jgi:hypothetical protein
MLCVSAVRQDQRPYRTSVPTVDTSREVTLSVGGQYEPGWVLEKRGEAKAVSSSAVEAFPTLLRGF